MVRYKGLVITLALMAFAMVACASDDGTPRLKNSEPRTKLLQSQGDPTVCYEFLYANKYDDNPTRHTVDCPEWMLTE